MVRKEGASAKMTHGRTLMILMCMAIPFLDGCAHAPGLPWNRPDPDLAAMASDSSSFVPDTSAVVDSRYEPDYYDRTTLAEPIRAPRGTAPGTTAPATAVTTPTPPDTVAVAPSTPPPTISVAIPEPERLRLSGAYLLDAAAADSLRKELAPRLTTVQAKEKLQTAADLLAQARAAAEAENVEAAANLAHKARLLVEELIPR
jgi:hypothetical protein